MLIRLIAGKEKDFVQFSTDPRSYHFKGNAAYVVFDAYGESKSILAKSIREAGDAVVDYIFAMVEGESRDNQQRGRLLKQLLEKSQDISDDQLQQMIDAMPDRHPLRVEDL